jgi:hypothetical protein
LTIIEPIRDNVNKKNPQQLEINLDKNMIKNIIYFLKNVNVIYFISNHTNRIESNRINYKFDSVQIKFQNFQFEIESN